MVNGIDGGQVQRVLQTSARDVVLLCSGQNSDAHRALRAINGLFPDSIGPLLGQIISMDRCYALAVFLYLQNGRFQGVYGFRVVFSCFWPRRGM